MPSEEFLISSNFVFNSFITVFGVIFDFITLYDLKCNVYNVSQMFRCNFRMAIKPASQSRKNAVPPIGAMGWFALRS
ncbi:MAG: hypothetical protein ACK5IJ_01295 [Mangrovibacterium sp.]